MARKIELVEVLEMEGNHLKKAKFRIGRKINVYYSMPEAARLWQVALPPAHRWYHKGYIDGVVTDPINNRRYVPQGVVERLMSDNRMKPYS